MIDKVKNDIDSDSGMIRSQLRDVKQIVFGVTDSCNLKCKYCGYGEFYNDYDEKIHKTTS